MIWYVYYQFESEIGQIFKVQIQPLNKIFRPISKERVYKKKL